MRQGIKKMADRALRKRETCVAKLEASMRQLKKYIDGDKPLQRIVQQKCDKVDVDREELIVSHHQYAERVAVSLSEEDMKTFIDPKIDAAVELVDEATLLLEQLSLEAEKNLQETKIQTQKNLELYSAKLQAGGNEEIIRVMLNDLLKHIAVVEPSEADASFVESILIDIQRKEEELARSWDAVKVSLTTGEEIEINFQKESEFRTLIYKTCSKGKQFISKARAPTELVSEVASNVSISHGNSVILEKMKPPKFSGNIREFARFKADFNSIVIPAYEDEVHQTYVLKERCLQGEAYHLVKNLDNSQSIWERLSDKYGDNIQIVDSVIKDIQSIAIQKVYSDEGLVNFVNILEKGVQDLTSIGVETEIANAYTVRLIEQKLPRRVMLKWLEQEKVGSGLERFNCLLKFLKGERKHIEKIISQKSDKEKEIPERKAKRLPVNSAGAKPGDGGKAKFSNSCLLHPNSNHLTRKCKEFLSKSVKERGQVVIDMEACKLCLSISHQGNECPWISKWDPCNVDSCKQYHSRLLHGCAIQGISCHIQGDKANSTDSKTLLLIQNIKSNGKEVLTFWDNGSSISLIAKHYARKHKLRGIKVSYDLVTIGNVVRPQNTTLYDVPIVDCKGDTHIIKSYEIDEICEDTECLNLNEIAKLFNNLTPEDIARPKRRVELLIGMNYAHLHPKAIESNGNLVLYRSLFGSGSVLGGQHRMIKGKNELNAFTKLVAKATFKNVKVHKPNKNIDFFTAEGFGVNVPPRCGRCKSCKECKFETHQLSLIEQRELEIIRDNLKLDPINNIWKTEYPYKIDPSVLKDNRRQALALLVRTENRLLKNRDAGDKYCEQFQDFVTRGIFKELTQEEMVKYEGPVSYISHHEVFKEDSSSTPVRLVLNTSLRFNGISLNDILMKGPNSLNDIFAVQLRFRSYTYALVGDIKKMYHSIRTTEKERHLRRVLWRDLNVDQEPRTYGTETVTFGDKPAASISAVAIQETAELYKHIDENAAMKIKQDMYVDDITTGDASYEKVEILKENIQKILSMGGFQIKGFVMSGDTCKDNLAILGTGDFGRVLGIGWDPGNDEFSVKVRVNLSKKFKGARKERDLNYDEISTLVNRKLTRRMLLGITNSCYDPFGLLSPLTVQLKIELRELYRAELDLAWDDDIPHERKIAWCSMLQLLKQAEKVRFKRCIYNDNSNEQPELVVFNDGSPSAMCAVAYVRWQLDDESFDTQLIASRTRVTPLDRMTIPRIEMQAAVLGVRLSKTIVESCKLDFKQITYISDSKCTLATLAKESTALKEFMGNRVAEILSFTTVSQWYHVKSSDNIADIGTRMNAKVRDIEKDSDWQLGPQWLRLTKDEWPVSQDANNDDVPTEELIYKNTCNLVMHNDSLFNLERMASRSYSFLMKTTARIFNLFENKSFKDNTVTPECLEKAEMYWLKESMIRTSAELKKGNLNSLRPMVDEDGIIVLSTRALKGFKLNYNVDRFPILTTKDPLAYMWMKEIHCEDHSGITKTNAKSRRKFWIVRGRSLAQRIKNSCYKCRILDKKLAGQLMSPLPDCRLSVAPVFDVTSIDLFGPLIIRDTVKKRTHMKVWGFIATCAAVRAVYLDVTESYATDAILQALRRFIAVRGCPREILSDQGTQLIAASKDIADLKDWNWSNVTIWAADNKIKWKLVPAEAPHQNGLSESLIRSVKRTIKHVIGDNILTFSELQLAFFEIANIINSRPLGIISGSDPDCPQSITPNDLLLGRSTNEVPNGPFDNKVSITKRFLFVQSLVDDWWRRWYESVLPSLVPSYKWLQRHRNVKVNDICLIKYKGLRSSYRLGRVIEASCGEDGLVRKVTLQYKLPAENKFRKVDRAIHGIAVIVPVEEQT